MFSKKRPSKKGCAIFAEPLKAMIKQAGKVAKPSLRELCGIIVSDGNCLHLVRTRNKVKRPCSFEITYREIRKVKRAARTMNYRLVGAFHSHPLSGAEPGDNDIKYAVDGTLMLIIECSSQEAKLWRIKKNKALPVPLHVIKSPV